MKNNLKLVDFVEILEFITRIRDDSVCARFPTGRTDFSVVIRILEGLDQAKRLVDGPADGEIIHSDLPTDYRNVKCECGFS